MYTYGNCDEEFRRNAVDLYLSSGKPLSTVAKELGVTPNSLRAWKKRMLGQNGAQARQGLRRQSPDLLVLGELPVLHSEHPSLDS